MNLFIRSRLAALLASKDLLEGKHIEGLLSDIKSYTAPADDGKVTALYTDGSMNGDSGKHAWATVTNEAGRCMITAMGADCVKDMDMKEVKSKGDNTVRRVAQVKFDGVKKQQNNGAELVAMLIALRMAKDTTSIRHIFCDSELIFKYWSVGRVRKDTKDAMDPKKIALLDECIALRKAFEQRGGILGFVSGDSNPADLGYH